MQDAPPQEVTIVGDDWEEPVVSLSFLQTLSSVVSTSEANKNDLQCRTGRWVVLTKMLDSMMSLRPVKALHVAVTEARCFRWTM